MQQATSANNLFHKVARESKLALSRNANVFIWGRSPVKDVVIACFNDEALNPLPTAPTLIRWFCLFNSWENQLVITPMKRLIHKDSDCLLYSYELLDHPLPLDDTKVLTCGEYACCYTGPAGNSSRAFQNPQPFPGVRRLPGTFQVVLRDAMGRKSGWKDIGHLDPESPNSILLSTAITPDLHKKALEKHGAKCIFTGSTGDTGDHCVGIHWIYPPAVLNALPSKSFGVGSRFSEINDTTLRVPANLVTMRADIHRLWLSHAISVDVDDNYRIITFNKDAQAVKLAATLEFDAADSDKNMRDECFREHLRWTLAIHVLRGHLVPDNFAYGEVEAFLDDVEYAADDVTPADLQSKKWRTPVGQLALEHIRLNNPGLVLELPEKISEHDGDTDEDMDSGDEITEDEN